eukprot:TRINITY_DN127_c0_g3_i1.p1 TRINITY_DN127_c0_g3~~TRINITY_DN127_c0_g3_i1.p1  ORF type:complete len:559 (-),score=124.83 TRINITY_DN127_c0_g3_i1:134-1810(-)
MARLAILLLATASSVAADCWHQPLEAHPGYSGTNCSHASVYDEGTKCFLQGSCIDYEGYVGTPDTTSFVICYEGKWLGRPRGCEFRGKCDAFQPVGVYIHGGCSGSALVGTVCDDMMCMTPTSEGVARGVAVCTPHGWWNNITGCTPKPGSCSQPDAELPMGYINQCGGHAEHSSNCHLVCDAARRFSGTVTAQLTCDNGTWTPTGPIEGCTPDMSMCAGMALREAWPELYKSYSLFDAKWYANGTMMSATTCQAGGGGTAGAVQGALKCVNGDWVASQPFQGCEARCAETPHLPEGAVPVGPCVAYAPHGQMCDLRCRHGFNGTMSGKVTCTDGSWEMTGVAPSAMCMAEAGRCGRLTGYFQPGYEVTGCDAYAADGTTCGASCAPPLTGSPTGTVSCVDGEFVGEFGGCAAPSQSCELPMYMCRYGDMVDGFEIEGNVADTCTIPHGRYVKVGCASGYVAGGGSFRDAVCVDGVLRNGWARHQAQLTCTADASGVPPTCDCGMAGRRSPSVEVTRGRVRETALDLWENVGALLKNWECWREDESDVKVIRCACRCA